MAPTDKTHLLFILCGLVILVGLLLIRPVRKKDKTGKDNNG